MKHVFNFNPNTHNLWPIYEAIVKYYPIGLRRDEHSILFDYPGLKDLGNIVADVVHNENDFYKSWLTFQDELSTILNCESEGTTMGQAPSLSTDFTIEKTETDHFIITKKLSVHLSLVGKFYTVYGKDESAIMEKQNDDFSRRYHAFNSLTASPYMEYEQPFKAAQQLIEQSFPGYQFIPFGVHSMIINGLRVRYSDKEICSVYDALFNHFLDSVAELTYKRGNSRYGYEEYWRIPNTEDQDIMVSISPPPSL